jgi:hypothetical protein
VQRLIRRRGVRLFLAVALLLLVAFVSGSSAASPPDPSGVQQYIETIPTATGGAATGRSAGSQSQPTVPAVTTSGTAASNGGGHAPGSTSTGRTGRSTTSPSTSKTSSSNDALKAAVRAGSDGGISRAALIGIILGAMTLGAVAIAFVRHRR